jgi:hypothetical protein
LIKLLILNWKKNLQKWLIRTKMTTWENIK